MHNTAPPTPPSPPSPPSPGAETGASVQPARSEGLLPADEDTPQVAEEVSLDQQSDQARHVGGFPPADGPGQPAGEAMAEALRGAAQPAPAPLDEAVQGGVPPAG